MKRILVGLALAAVCFAGAARAEGCRTLSLKTSGVHVETIKLYDREGKLQGRVERSALGADVQVTDCGDPVYVMLPYDNKGYLVRKAELTTPEMRDACLCLAPGSKPVLGVPGAADIRSCPLDRCRR
jgi:hypothetical protein